MLLLDFGEEVGDSGCYDDGEYLPLLIVGGDGEADDYDCGGDDVGDGCLVKQLLHCLANGSNYAYWFCFCARVFSSPMLTR